MAIQYNIRKYNKMRKSPQHIVALVVLILPLISTSTIVLAEDKGGGDLRSAVQNPISSLISLPLKLTFDQGAKNGNGTILNANPVIPVTVGDWNLVNRLGSIFNGCSW